MATSKSSPQKASPAQPTDQAFAPPAQQVWLAGLGAMAKAQEQGSKAMETLLNDGLAFQRKSQAEAQQRLQEATERLGHLASDFGQSASGRVDKLEHLFEDRVAKALHRLGMPSLLDIQMLSERVAQLESQVQALQGQASKASPAAQKPAAKKPAAKASRPAAKPATASRKKSA
ncbi:phasin family protein [Limnohabitans sp. 63ED37-2]|uniref:phasin family protein n=1 Tax=Limnohabitans sp. 63ED37-2 TaxID=1678128 RepID=UPI0007066169|nr:phasin family protein [Limnohabitans sp. 63ED37-2]ALK87329.1 Poly(hydroxyalcanoate) granule associated protein (phasin) [Limnohabitans sp. 63ED37-2]